jgi:hypothetical protein
VYFTDVTGYQIVFDARTAQPSQSPVVTLQNTSRLQYLWNSASFVAFGPTTLSPNTWYHVAIVRASGVHTGYVNGVSYSLSTTDAAGVTSAPMIVGARTVGGANDYLKGYISNFRMVKGTAVYTAAFTPPTSPVTAITNTSLLLNMANAGIYDAAAQNDVTTVGDAQTSTTPTPKFGVTTSIKFDPTTGVTTDSLSILPVLPSLTLGTADFTIEGWVYFNTVAGAQTIFDQRPTGGNGAYPCIYMNGATMVWYVNTAGQITSGALSTLTWYYFAVTRASSVTRMYINGVQVVSTYSDTNNYLAAQSIVGNGIGLVSSVNGNLQEFRITRGVARTVTTIPTAPFPTR